MTPDYLSCCNHLHHELFRLVELVKLLTWNTSPFSFFAYHLVSRYRYSSATLFKHCYNYSSLIAMFTHLLTDLERKRIRAFIKADGEKGSATAEDWADQKPPIPPQDREDLELICEFLQHYEREKAEKAKG